MRVFIRVVPDANPNGIGRIIEVDAPPGTNKVRTWVALSAVLNSLAPEGHHVVAYFGEALPE